MTSTNLVPPDSERFIQHGAQWTVSSSGTLIAYLNDGNGDLRGYAVTDANLASMHEKLPSAIRAILVDREKSTWRPIAGGGVVRDTLKLLREETLTITTKEGPVIFKAIKAVKNVDSTAPDVVVVGTILHTRQYQTEDGPILIAANRLVTQVIVGKEDLDKQLPGWTNRIDAGLTLGLEDEALYQYALFERRLPGAPVDLNGVTFE